jgi:hypothetical protein
MGSTADRAEIKFQRQNEQLLLGAQSRNQFNVMDPTSHGLFFQGLHDAPHIGFHQDFRLLPFHHNATGDGAVAMAETCGRLGMNTLTFQGFQ